MATPSKKSPESGFGVFEVKFSDTTGVRGTTYHVARTLVEAGAMATVQHGLLTDAGLRIWVSDTGLVSK